MNPLNKSIFYRIRTHIDDRIFYRIYNSIRKPIYQRIETLP